MHFTIVARSCLLACLLNLPYAFAFPTPTIQPRQYLPELVRGEVRDAGAAGSSPFTNPFGGSPPPNLPPPGSPPPQFADALLHDCVDCDGPKLIPGQP